MKPEEIPQELLGILDARAGKAHSRQGPVVAALAEILTRYDELRAIQWQPHHPVPAENWGLPGEGTWCKRCGYLLVDRTGKAKPRMWKPCSPVSISLRSS